VISISTISDITSDYWNDLRFYVLVVQESIWGIEFSNGTSYIHGDFLLRTLKQPKPLDESIVSNAHNIYTDTVAFIFFFQYEEFVLNSRSLKQFHYQSLNLGYLYTRLHHYCPCLIFLLVHIDAFAKYTSKFPPFLLPCSPSLVRKYEVDFGENGCCHN
jgi:hypothetical protein